ncbi:MAG: flagellar M-ring protein FliF [Phycisphaerae bacterium]|nr:flagellar M-ring protein FliF [Phycisphaerae bacterium]NIP55495.1 flagellar M-ring protein FliF [Phycisphaerae bacterium]NIS51727.1 flagellar M-ring protein FliF [Phycisphaerae bacterium]NIU11808.1 flagellar M-ring protein FliF [Phycisphaerae bacterium]NIU60056.1 flagellar M-ring protein FliF [Phycisphaerae bacterium]
MSFFQKIGAIWQKVSIVQRALLIAIVLTFVVIGVLLTNWARRPDMRMLYQQLSPEEASKITEKISEKDIVYELRNGGTSIFVPKEKVYQLRLDMAKEGLASGEQGGYKIFDNEKIGVSPFVQSVNLKRALQEELAKSIQMIDGVVHARVHMVTPEQTLFTSEAGQTTASVILRLKPGYRLSALNIAAITNLVSGSVEGLNSDNVTVIDSQGRLLSTQSDNTMASGAGTVQEYRERVEQNLSDKVEEMLETVLGPGRATVRVSAVIDMNSISTVTEKLEPKGVATKEEITTGSETEPGVASTAGQPPAPGGIKKDETITTEYEIGKTVKQELMLPGRIKSLSVAAFVDLSAADANAAPSTAGSALIMELTEVEEIIRNALGLRKTDALKVVNVRFHQPDVASMIDEKPSFWPRIMGIVRHASLGIMAICALLVLRIFRGAKTKAAPVAPTGQLAGAEGPAGLLPAEVGKSEPLVLRKQIASALQSNPAQVKQLFSNWLEEKGG